MEATSLPRYHDFDFGMISSLFLKLHTSNSLSALSTPNQSGTLSRIAFSYCSMIPLYCQLPLFLLIASLPANP